MFILDVLPTWLFYLIAISGLILFAVCQFATQLPIISKYGTAALTASVLLIVLGCYFVGASSEHKIWKDRVQTAEQKVEVLKNIQPEINRIVVTEYVDRPIEVIKERTKTIIQKIPQVITREIDAACNIPKSVVELHNEAILGVKID